MSAWKSTTAAALFTALLCAAAMAQDNAAAPAPPAVETTTPEVEQTSTPPVVEAATPATVTTESATAENATEAPGRIVFFRPSRLSGAVYTYHVVEVAEDGDSTRESPRIGSLPNGQYFEAAVAPGIHNYNIRGPMAVNLDEDRLRIEVEPGETYYVEQTLRIGLLTGGFRLVPSTQAEFERRRLRQWTPREAGENERAQQGAGN